MKLDFKTDQIRLNIRKYLDSEDTKFTHKLYTCPVPGISFYEHRMGTITELQYLISSFTLYINFIFVADPFMSAYLAGVPMFTPSEQVIMPVFELNNTGTLNLKDNFGQEVEITILTDYYTKSEFITKFNSCISGSFLILYDVLKNDVLAQIKVIKDEPSELRYTQLQRI